MFVLSAADGCIPSDLATGTPAEIEEERRLMYVAMTRAKNHLAIVHPLRFFIRQQHRHGDRHVFTPRTRFIPDAIVDRFDRVVPGRPRRRRRALPAPARSPASTSPPASAPPGPRRGVRARPVPVSRLRETVRVRAACERRRLSRGTAGGGRGGGRGRRGGAGAGPSSTSAPSTTTGPRLPNSTRPPVFSPPVPSISTPISLPRPSLNVTTVLRAPGVTAG